VQVTTKRQLSAYANVNYESKTHAKTIYSLSVDGLPETTFMALILFQSDFLSLKYTNTSELE